MSYEKFPIAPKKRLAICNGCEFLSVDRCRLSNRLVSVMASRELTGPPGCLWPGSAPPATPAERVVKPSARLKDVRPSFKKYDPPAEQYIDEASALALGPDDLAVVTCFFNPAGYKKPLENFHRFADAIQRAGVPLYVVELSFNGEFEIPATLADNVRRITADPARSTLWQKERLLNIAIDDVPERFKGIGWLDSDVLFVRNDWPTAVAEALGRWNWVQPYTTSWRSTGEGQLEEGKKSSGWFWQHQRLDFLRFRQSHPGFAWFGRAEFLRAHGLLETNITGGGDCSMLQAVTSAAGHYAETGFGRWRRAVEAWAGPAREQGGGALGYCDGDLVHLYHGSLENRQYNDRFAALIAFGFEPEVDVELDPESDVLRWTDLAIASKPDLVAWVSNYFHTRKEDE